MALIISNIASFSQTLTIKFEAAARLKEERFIKNSKFYSIDFLHFFAKRRKSVEKMTQERKIGVNERARRGM